MINGKAIGISAGCGFVLSFLTGLISRNSAGGAFLRALIFALVFAALAALISFLYSKFLADESESYVSESSASSSKPSTTGSKVDIVVSDDTLEDDDSGPKFFVENNRQSLTSGENLRSNTQTPEPASSPVPENKIENAEAVSSASVAPAPGNQSPSFQPVNLGGENKVDASDAINPANPAQRTEGSSDNVEQTGAIESVDNIESLPDIGDFDEKKSGDSGNVISDSDFATGSTGSSSASSAKFPDGKTASDVDTDTMAKAIHTLLAKDNA